MTDKSNIEEAFAEFLEKHFSGTNKKSGLLNETPKTLTKAVDEEQRKALFVVLVPEEEDLHGDVYSALEIEKGCHNYNIHCGKSNLFHEIQDIKDSYPVESYILPSELSLEDGRTITKGTWVQLWHFEDTEAGNSLWELTKSGDITGVSIGCLATVQELDND